jgi:hypothetical protein
MSFGEAGDNDFARLTRDLRLGYGTDVDVQIVDTHHSKSKKLPIVATECEGWNTSVAWYAFNYHNHYSAFRFQRALSAMLLYPISGTFGRKHQSGHESGCPVPDLTNYQKDYWNRRPLEGFASFVGDWHMATTIRYLEAASKIDVAALYDVVMDKTKYGKMDNIDGNAVDFELLCTTVGVPKTGTYDREVVVPPNRIVKAIRIDWFGVETDIRPACVTVEPMPGVLLPASTGTGLMFVDPVETRLRAHLDDTVQLPWTEETKYKDPRMLTFVPADIFRYFSREPEDYRARKAHFDKTPWRVCGAYNVTGLDARLFRFAVPNPLDAALYVKWWLEAGIPCAEAALTRMEKTNGQGQEQDVI